MQLTESTTHLECSHEFKKIGFNIGDPILIMEFLRKNCYSNPKRAICQEIMCNARDAHRELGLNKPIIVKLPNRLQPTWSVKDFGPGINPSRMEDVFVLFGNSTKRGDNLQTGGFGVGSKTPWAYTDTFLIDTVCEIEGSLIEYHYAAVIGEDRKPDLIPVSEPCISKETSTGTTISFNVAAQDQSDFARYSYDVSAFWDLKPEIIGNSDYKSLWEFDNDNAYKYKTATWGILIQRNCDRATVLIDKIAYTLNTDILGEKFTSAMQSLIRYNSCHLFFGIGELTISLNREALYYDQRTINALVKRMQEMIDYIMADIEKQVSTCATLWDSAIALREAINFFNGNSSFVKGVKWNGKVIPTAPIWNESSSYIEILYYEKQPMDARKYPNTVRRFTGYPRITFYKNAALICGDSKAKIEHMFAKDNTLKHVYSFRPRYEDDAECKTIFDKWVTKNNIMDLNPINVDDLEAAPKRARSVSSREPYRRVKTYLWNGSDWADTEISSEAFENEKAIYVPCFRRRACTDNNCACELSEVGISIPQILRLVRNNSKLKIYGIQKDLLPELGAGWISLFDYIRNLAKEVIVEKKITGSDMINLLTSSSGNTTHTNNLLVKVIKTNLDKMPKALKEWHTASEMFTKLSNDQTLKITGHCIHSVFNFLKLGELDNKFKSLQSYKEEAFKESKLLETIEYNYRYGHSCNDCGDDVILYLEAVYNRQVAQAASAP